MVGLVHGVNDSKPASSENLSTRVARWNHITDQLRDTVELRHKYGCNNREDKADALSDMVVNCVVTLVVMLNTQFLINVLVFPATKRWTKRLGFN